MMLRWEEVQQEKLAQTRIFHFGTLSMTHEQVKDATQRAVQHAQKEGALISFDPNLRPPLWNSLEDAARQMWYGIGQCDILKISDDEIAFLTGKKDIDQGIAGNFEKKSSDINMCNYGKTWKQGILSGKSVFCEPFLRDDTIETTGAGDTFMACVLNAVLEKGLDSLTEDDLHEMLRFANAASSIITTRKGALKVMPKREEIISVLTKE